MHLRVVVPILVAVLIGSAARADTKTEVRATYGAEQLDIPAPDWHSAALDVDWRYSRDDAAWLGFHRADRFGLAEDELALGGHVGVGGGWGLQLDASAAGGAVLPSGSVRIGADRPLGGGFVFHFGQRAARYDSASVGVTDLGMERYAGQWRYAYTMYRGAVRGSGASGIAHLLQADRYYGHDSRIGISYATGSEAERVSATAVSVTDVRELALAGTHMFDDAWGFSWRVARHEQGTLYRRDGAELGVVFRF